MEKSSVSKLRKVLMGNAAFSGVSGLALSLFSQAIASWMGVAQSFILLAIGIGLILFSVSLIVAGRKKELNRKNIQFIIFQDWAWVFGSAVIIIFQLFNLTQLGYWLVADVAIIVAAFAVFQGKYLKVLRQKS